MGQEMSKISEKMLRSRSPFFRVLDGKKVAFGRFWAKAGPGRAGPPGWGRAGTPGRGRGQAGADGRFEFQKRYSNPGSDSAWKIEIQKRGQPIFGGWLGG